MILTHGIFRKKFLSFSERCDSQVSLLQLRRIRDVSLETLICKEKEEMMLKGAFSRMNPQYALLRTHYLSSTLITEGLDQITGMAHTGSSLLMG